MDHSKISGMMWVFLGIFLTSSGIVSLIKKNYAAALAPLIMGITILAFQGYIYKRTGSVKGVL